MFLIILLQTYVYGIFESQLRGVSNIELVDENTDQHIEYATLLWAHPTPHASSTIGSDWVLPRPTGNCTIQLVIEHDHKVCCFMRQISEF